ncbi:MAG: hypothetical protein ABIU05_00895, partial [Nitrospirales bacterium]
LISLAALVPAKNPKAAKLNGDEMRTLDQAPIECKPDSEPWIHSITKDLSNDEGGESSISNAIVVRIGLNCIHSVHIQAPDSSTEEELRLLLMSVLPILEQLRETVNGFRCEPVGASS